MTKKITKELAIEFVSRLEENEAMMAEGAAMMVTLEQFGLEWGDQNEIFIALPEGKGLDEGNE
tara:strand:- start:93 stop:281 length:189 start_codon:yes stop_codon:yes gene_type:complete